MPGLAVFVNEAVPHGKSLQLFYNTEDLQLALQLKDGSASPSDPNHGLSAKPPVRPGIIPNGTSIGAAEYLGTSVVASLTQPKLPPEQEDYTEYDVSIVSPVYMPFSSTEKDNTAVAMSSSGKAAWVYFLKGSNSSNLSINEFVLGSPAVTQIPGLTRIALGSELAAYYDDNTKQRSVLYQEDAESGRIIEYNIDTTDITPINSTSNSKEKTVICVDMAGKSAYLYYLGKANVIYRVVKDAKHGWGESNQVPGAQPCAPGSDLTVANSNSVNHLFYSPQDAESYDFAHTVDAL